ncbi:type IX secretion system protein PorM/GldM [Foetidibacter luteolus]|uniref:type IX secretion system motor protein PorM/GldM n=1 Tax=Foetidibacter luteolus TaxID=2608880 RepID=UPI00129AFB02|nr:gliding motility protein GldM [Foetidibacter luteolus]
MALPKEPRQKMINLMYLVLTALLALNVSAEILNAFRTVNTSLNNASSVIDQKNAALFKSFQEKLKDEKTKEQAAKWQPKALEAKRLADNIYNYVESLKLRLKTESGLEIKNGVETYKEDETNVPTRVMIEGGDPQAKVLYQRLKSFKDSLLNIDPEIKSAYQNSLPIDLSIPKTQNSGNNSWEAAYFRMTPTIAAITILSKFQNDIKNSEAQVVDFLHRKVGEVQFVTDTYQPLIGQSSNYLMPGQELTITAGIGAYNSAAKPTVTVDGSAANPNSSGIPEVKFNVGGPGSYTKTVHITFRNQLTNQLESKDYKVEYTVGSPTGASVSADAVKVLYIGLDNPITVSGGNVGDERVTISIDNGTATKTSAGKYMIRPGKAGNATITVNADGKSTPFPFKVKDVPDPIAMVGQSKGGRMRVNDFKAQAGVRAVLENFVFDGVKFNVVSYTIVFTGAGFSPLQFREVTGERFDPVRSLIENCRVGTTVTIDEIKASGPGGTRDIPPIVFNLF